MDSQFHEDYMTWNEKKNTLNKQLKLKPMEMQTYWNCETGGQCHLLPTVSLTVEKMDGLLIIGLTVSFWKRWHALEVTYERKPKWEKGHPLKKAKFSNN